MIRIRLLDVKSANSAVKCFKCLLSMACIVIVTTVLLFIVPHIVIIDAVAVFGIAESHLCEATARIIA